MASGFSTLVLPDGAKLAYEVLGSLHLGRQVPIVLICGMSSVRTDFERLSHSLMKTRPVLIYDHRGMGNSSLIPTCDEDMTIELLARDLLTLLTHLKWKEVALCGYSMGGVIAQQLLLLPYHNSRPTPLPFRTTHLILAGTRSVVQEVGLGLTPASSNRPRTPAERREIARRVVASLFDPAFLETNGKRFEIIFDRTVAGLSLRPPEVLMKQGVALKKFDFKNLLGKLPRELKILVIHGALDEIIPLYCGEDILKRIPRARPLEKGNQPGQVPTLDFGHYWYEYFDVEVWHSVVDKFMCSDPKRPQN